MTSNILTGSTDNKTASKMTCTTDNRSNHYLTGQLNVRSNHYLTNLFLLCLLFTLWQRQRQLKLLLLLNLLLWALSWNLCLFRQWTCQILRRQFVFTLLLRRWPTSIIKPASTLRSTQTMLYLRGNITCHFHFSPTTVSVFKQQFNFGMYVQLWKNYYKKPYYCKETTRCRSCSFSFKVRRHSLQVWE